MSDGEVGNEAATTPQGGPADAAEERWPVGFILTIVMVGIYLAYRLIQGIVLFVDWVL